MAPFQFTRKRFRFRNSKRLNRRRSKTSKCCGKKKVVCQKTRGCKYAKGKKRTFCRKMYNRRRRRNYRGGGILNGAALPFGLFALQKFIQKRQSKNKKSKK
tara:strand:- start:2250 stop:2552 length:303 start_codon:yes stop_codon:yes gene_type:complete